MTIQRPLLRVFSTLLFVLIASQTSYLLAQDAQAGSADSGAETVAQDAAPSPQPATSAPAEPAPQPVAAPVEKVEVVKASFQARSWLESGEKSSIVATFEGFVGWLGGKVFFPIWGIPLVVWVLVIGATFFTFYMRFINLRAFGHALAITRGDYDDPNDPGEISHFQALTSALSATVGLGNIAGVAVAVGLGGPGAVFWMILIAFFGMTAKFVECTLAQKWRKIDDDGVVHGGPMYYLSIGLKERGLGKLGAVFGGFFAVCIIGGAFGGGNMFQANQSYELAATQVPVLADNAWLYGVILALLVGAVILGGIKRIGAATSKIVPFMAGLYVVSCLYIILTNLGEIPGVMASILYEAFNGTDPVYGGIIGALVVGMKRAVFSNEAGVGSAAIAHSAAKTDEPVREGMVAMLGPFIDTVVICMMTASVILITKPPELNDMYVAKRNQQVLSHCVALEVQTESANHSVTKEQLAACPGIQTGSKSLMSAGEAKTLWRVDDAGLAKLVKDGQVRSSAKDGLRTLTPLETNLLRSNVIYGGSPYVDQANAKDLLMVNDAGLEQEVAKGHVNKRVNEEGQTEYKILSKARGAAITSAAFGTTITWFPWVLSIVVFLFAYSTMISWCYYGEQGWIFLFGAPSLIVYRVLFLGAVVLGSVANLGAVLEFSDIMIFMAAFPNILGGILLSPVVRRGLDDYWARKKAGEFKRFR
jgi:amino acid carrier protein